jgi:septal ring-binding cell division protein DamX
MSRIKITRKHITLRANPNYWYPIQLSSIQSFADLNEWLVHLDQKNWFTPQLREQFIQAVFTAKGW